MQKSQIFYENWLYQEQRPFDVKRPLLRSNSSSINKGGELSIEMPSHQLTEI